MEDSASTPVDSIPVDSAGNELLFSDGLPQPDVDGGFKGAVAARAAGISYRQLDYWARWGLA